MAQGLDADSITLYHDAFLQVAQHASDAPGAGGDAWRAVVANHQFNCLLWREEDKARRQDVPAADIADGKRRIDSYNQQRNDAVEAIDEAILGALASAGVTPGPDARLSSETAGAMIDRLSILALKIHHMREQTLRLDAGAAHVDACAARLGRLVTQRADLSGCLDRLLFETRDGRAYFKVYRQYKMYNDPALNPWLYGAAQALNGPGQGRPA